MTITFRDLVGRLKMLDEVTLLEVLDLSSGEIVDRFEDLIEYRFDEILAQVSNDSEEDDEDPLSF